MVPEISNLLDSSTWNGWYSQPIHSRRPNLMSGHGLNLEYYATKVLCLSDYNKSKCFRPKNLYHFGQEVYFLGRYHIRQLLLYLLSTIYGINW